jgi:hypothetical protein
MKTEEQYEAYRAARRHLDAELRDYLKQGLSPNAAVDAANKALSEDELKTLLAPHVEAKMRVAMGQRMTRNEFQCELAAGNQYHAELLARLVALAENIRLHGESPEAHDEAIALIDDAGVTCLGDISGDDSPHD